MDHVLPSVVKAQLPAAATKARVIRMGSVIAIMDMQDRHAKYARPDTMVPCVSLAVQRLNAVGMVCAVRKARDTNVPVQAITRDLLVRRK